MDEKLTEKIKEMNRVNFLAALADRIGGRITFNLIPPFVTDNGGGNRRELPVGYLIRFKLPGGMVFAGKSVDSVALAAAVRDTFLTFDHRDWEVVRTNRGVWISQETLDRFIDKCAPWVVVGRDKARANPSTHGLYADTLIGKLHELEHNRGHSRA